MATGTRMEDGSCVGELMGRLDILQAVVDGLEQVPTVKVLAHGSEDNHDGKTGRPPRHLEPLAKQNEQRQISPLLVRLPSSYVHT